MSQKKCSDVPSTALLQTRSLWLCAAVEYGAESQGPLSVLPHLFRLQSSTREARDARSSSSVSTGEKRPRAKLFQERYGSLVLRNAG